MTADVRRGSRHRRHATAVEEDSNKTALQTDATVAERAIPARCPPIEATWFARSRRCNASLAAQNQGPPEFGVSVGHLASHVQRSGLHRLR